MRRYLRGIHPVDGRIQLCDFDEDWRRLAVSAQHQFHVPR
jgi:hypothetical protein